VRRTACSLLILLLAARPAAADPELNDVKTSLQQVNRKKNDVRRQQKKQAREEQSFLKRLDAADNAVEAARRDQQADEHNLVVAEANIAKLESLGIQYDVELADKRAMLSRELRLIFRAGPMGEVRLLLSAKEPAELLSRYRFLKTLAMNNADRVEEMRKQLNQVDEVTRENKVRELEIQNLKSSAQANRLKAESKKRSYSALLNGIRQRKSQTLALLKELDETHQNLEAKMLEMQRAAQEEEQNREQAQHSSAPIQLDQGPSRLGRRHSLPWPVRGPLLTLFGEQMHPKFHTKVFNRGIEIGAALGSPVIAVADGTARFADYFEGFGQMVILDHGGNYFTVYGHNSQLSVREGEVVHQGQQIAEVGDSSTLGRPSLYFEIRSLAKAVDPMIWLSR
jgi:septal ring factor EnvC (AmiA/AmiB activator)